jgi:hypothetical protein
MRIGPPQGARRWGSPELLATKRDQLIDVVR